MSKLVQTSDCLSTALKTKDEYTQGHCSRVEFLCEQLGQSCNLDAYETRLLKLAARLHDVGKIGIPDHILLKPARLDADEFEIIKSHSVLGQTICDKIPYAEAMTIGLFVRHHHEAFDGSGYPDGLSGEQIPLCSRMISLADSCDAMLTTRPYQRARTHDEVMGILQSECGKKSDPVLFGHFERIVSSTEFISQVQ